MLIPYYGSNVLCLIKSIYLSIYLLVCVVGEVGRGLAGRKVESMAMLLHGSELQLHLCGPGEKVVSTHSVSQQASVREFFSSLVNTHLDRSLLHPRLDFLAAHPAHHPQHAQAISAALTELLQVCGGGGDVLLLVI
ncbi:hypothetical protein E2C01_097988 [Portunus trituberculatus]|uniref:Uncharacterized protein n=1 Tax=Portunus trituberculatus TaxID=210409 RepID=A0A5B7KBQ5_PORTR|nr:hypothetical protein [Portunus trituberculatus]